MDEDRLSPQLGRLIDSAKAAALRSDPSVCRAEAVALLTDQEGVYAGFRGGDAAHPDASAAEVALALARQAGDGAIAAAAVAVANDASPTLLPSAECRRCLAEVDPDLPVVVKQHGRWVLLLLSQLPSPE